MCKNRYLMSVFTVCVFVFWGCGDNSKALSATEKVTDTKAQTESCSWVYALTSGEHTVEYKASCVEATIGDLDKDHCLSKYKGSVGESCETKTALLTCTGILLDAEAGTRGTAYIYDAQLEKLLEINAELSEIELCEIFRQEFVK